MTAIDRKESAATAAWNRYLFTCEYGTAEERRAAYYAWQTAVEKAERALFAKDDPEDDITRRKAEGRAAATRED